MAIQNIKESETIVVYDVNLKAYHEICLEDAKEQLKSLLSSEGLIELLKLNKKDVAKIVEKII